MGALVRKGDFMDESPKSEVRRPLFGRRRVVGDGLATLLASAVVPSFLQPFVSVRPADPSPSPTPSPTPGESGTPAKTLKLRHAASVDQLDARFRPFIGEKLVYDVNFMGLIKAASVVVTLKQGIGEEIISELEAKATGMVSWASKTKRQVMKTRLRIMDTGGGKTRLVPLSFSRESERPDRKYRSLQQFDYRRGYWYVTIEINGKRKSRKRKKIPPGVYYEDFVGFAYNLRAGVYGPANPGDVIKIEGIPYKDVSSYTIRVATQKEWDDEAKWAGDVPGAKKLGIVEIKQEIFGFKPGVAKVLIDDKLVPVAAKVSDVVSYGDVSTRLVERKKG